MQILIVLSIVAGIASLLYFGVCMAYTGLSASFTVVWLGIGAVFLGTGIVLRYVQQHEILIPKGIRVLTAVLVLVVIAGFVYAESLILYQGAKQPPEDAEYMVILGARVKGRTITKSLQKRLDTAAAYLREHEEVKVIVSGGKGKGEDISEAEAMEAYLLEAGIAADRIMKEDRSTNTGENMKYSRELIGNDAANVILVTNGFHIYRATMIAKAQGMTNVSGLAAPTDRILAVSYYTREALAVWKYKITGEM